MEHNNETKLKITNSILEGVPSKDACKTIGVSQSYFRQILKENNLKWIRSVHRIYELNHNYFDEIDTPEKAYWLGFLYADGHVSDTGALHLQLQGRDIEVLENLKKAVNYNGNIKLRKIKNKDYYGLRIWSVQMCASLRRLGINRQKTKSPQIPIIKTIFYKDFIRGLIDGDGTIYYKRKSQTKMTSCVHILIHRDCLPQVINMIESFTKNFTCSIANHHRTDYLKIISVDGNRQVLKLLDNIYDHSALFLNRKYNKFLEIKKFYTDNPILLEKTERIQCQSHRSQENLILFPKISGS